MFQFRTLLLLLLIPLTFVGGYVFVTNNAQKTDTQAKTWKEQIRATIKKYPLLTKTAAGITALATLIGGYELLKPKPEEEKTTPPKKTKVPRKKVRLPRAKFGNYLDLRDKNAQFISTTFFAQFKGHEGPEASLYAKKHFLAKFKKQMKKHENNPTIAFQKTFEKIDKNFLDKARDENLDSGTTAIACYINRNEKKLWVANLGNSRAVVSENGKALQLSQDHTYDNDAEKNRIQNFIVKETPQLKLFGTQADPTGMIRGGKLNIAREGEDPSRRVTREIDVTRSIGDRPFKEKIPEVLINTPDVEEYSFKDKKGFLILATPDIWNVMNNQDAVDFVHEKLEDEEITLSKIASMLAKKASDLGGEGGSMIVIISF